MHAEPPSTHVWKFFRTGGIDQVALETGADLLALDQLDQELWVALSCPVKGLELDERTLALIDTDGDGRIGVPEVIAAVSWACARLNDSGDLLKGADALPLSAINAGTPDGKVLLAAARQILAGVGSKGVEALTVAGAADTARIFASNPLNGDGLIPLAAAGDAETQALIKDIIDCLGGAARRSGDLGVTAEKIDAFFTQLAAYGAWSERKAALEVALLGGDTESAFDAIKAVRAKVDDFFARCQLAAFDARATGALNRDEADYRPIASHELKLSGEELSGFPLSHIEAGRPLPLLDGVNPAWVGALAALQEKAVTPLLGASVTFLTADQWTALVSKFSAYEAWLGENGGRAVEKIGLARTKEILAGRGREALAELVERDKALEPQFKAVSDVERLTRYYRDLRALLHNFVNFADFYSWDKYAAFQAGTLFLDSRSTELCLRVDGISPLAAMSKFYIVYCACTRAGGGATMTIAACFTQGASDYLFVGRNGVFYDRKGVLWYAVVTSIVDNPISIRQAFWSPFKKFIRFVEEQVAKRAATADASTGTRLNSAASVVAADAPKPEPKKFDLALITGIGVAIGSIGTFGAAVFAKFVELPSWQVPLIIVGLLLVIALPSMFIAALKLRQRTLGPILEGNGWAINGRVKINIPFGAALTKVATLPPNAQRSLEDPYEDKEAKRQRRRIVAALVILLAAAVWIRVNHNHSGHYFWESPKVEKAAAEPAK
jgi:MFS family permease